MITTFLLTAIHLFTFVYPLRLHAGIQISESNFDQLTKDGLWFIEHFSPFCGHCKRFAPTWIQLVDAAKPFEARGLRMGQIDCIAQGDLCVKLGVDFYPQMKLFDTGAFVESYSGERTLETLMAYLDDKSSAYRTRHPLPSTPTTNTSAPSDKPVEQLHTAKPLDQLLTKPLVQIVDISPKPAPPPTQAEEAPKYLPNPDGKVVKLNLTSWRNYTESGSTLGPTFIKYHVPWCPHCRQLAPTWQDLAHVLTHQINVAELDCDSSVDNKELCSKEDVAAFPTLIFYQDGVKVTYNGARSLSAMQTFAHKAAVSTGVAAKDISPEGLGKVLHTEEVLYLFLYGSSTATSDITAVQEAAQKLLGTVIVFKSNATDLFTKFSVPTGQASLLVFKDFSTEPWAVVGLDALRRGTGLLTARVERWLSGHSLPLLPELTAATYAQVFASRTRRLVVLACLRTQPQPGGEARAAAAREQVRVWARQWRKSQEARGVKGPVDWVWLDADQWSDWLYNNYNLHLPVPTTDPKASSHMLMIIDPSKHLYYDSQANGQEILFEGTSVFQTLLAVEMGVVSGKVAGGAFERIGWRIHWLVFGTVRMMTEHYMLFILSVLITCWLGHRSLKMRRARLMSLKGSSNGWGDSPRLRSVGLPAGSGGVGNLSGTSSGVGVVTVGCNGGGGNGGVGKNGLGQVFGMGSGGTKVD